jgi:hypothetical protein
MQKGKNQKIIKNMPYNDKVMKEQSHLLGGSIYNAI